MNKNKLVDYKFSLFGDFAITQANVRKVAQLLGDGFSHDILSNEIINGNVFPVFVFHSSDIDLRIGRIRLDFIFKKQANDDLETVIKYIEMIKPNLPDSFGRFAINLSFNVLDTEMSKMNKLSRLSLLSSIGSNVREFVTRQNFATLINNVRANNIITIQTGKMFDKTDFLQKDVVLCSLDVNTVPFPIGLGNSVINKENISSFVKDAYKIAIEDEDKLLKLLEDKTDA